MHFRVLWRSTENSHGVFGRWFAYIKYRSNEVFWAINRLSANGKGAISVVVFAQMAMLAMYMQRIMHHDFHLFNFRQQGEQTMILKGVEDRMVAVACMEIYSQRILSGNIRV